MVGDRGMIAQARIEGDLKPARIDWITALKASQLAAEGGPAAVSFASGSACKCSCWFRQRNVVRRFHIALELIVEPYVERPLMLATTVKRALHARPAALVQIVKRDVRACAMRICIGPRG
jgi:hypothetical protein